MSRTASATPPPPYFPQRTSTPTLRHAAPPSSTAVHFPRSISASTILGPEKGKRRIKHLPPSLSGLRSKKANSTVGAGMAKGAVTIVTDVEAGFDLGLGSAMDDAADGDASRVETAQSEDDQMGATEGDGQGEDLVGLNNPILDAHLPIGVPIIESKILPHESQNRFAHAGESVLSGSVAASPSGDSTSLLEDTTPALVPPPSLASSSPSTASGSSKSWVSHFGFGKVAKAVSSGINHYTPPWSTSGHQDGSAGDKDKRKTSLSSPSVTPQHKLPSLTPLRIPDLPQIPTTPILDVRTYHSDAIFSPQARALDIPQELLDDLEEDEVKRKKREWAEAQLQRLTECARLCSQWPHSGYNMSKWGPNGPKHFYEPQSYGNPEYVKTVMARQAALEQTMSTDRGLYFPSYTSESRTRSRYSSSSSGGESVESVDNSALPSPTTSMATSGIEGDAARVDDQTAAEIRLAMGEPLLLAAASSASAPAAAQGNNSQVSLQQPTALSSVAGAGAVSGASRIGSPKSLKAARSLTELNALASSMALTKRDREHERPASLADVDVDVDVDMEVETDTTSLAPSLANSDLLEPPAPAPSHASCSGLVRDKAQIVTRPTRAQSCGSKRPLPAAATRTSAGTGTGAGADEEKRRRVHDEAMVVEEAVSTGVIQPTASSPGAGTVSCLSSPKTAPRLCASTPDLGALSKATKSVADTTAAVGAGAGASTPEAIPNGTMFGHVVKTSDTHPIIISSFFPSDLLPVLATHLTASIGLSPTSSPGLGSRVPIQLGSNIDVPALLLSHAHTARQQQSADRAAARGAAPISLPITTVPSPSSASFSFSFDLSLSGPGLDSAAQSTKEAPAVPRLGNLFLSSCPGKRLRMEGPIKGRGPVCRDIKVDLKRIKAEGVGCLVCCLDDPELALLGTPWETYRDVANDLGLDIIRVPMPDGFTPVSLALFDSQITLIASKYTLRGINVLVHCRGGVGRAGVTACAWAIKMGFVQPHPSLALVEEAAKRKAASASPPLPAPLASPIPTAPATSTVASAASASPEKKSLFPFFSGKNAPPPVPSPAPTAAVIPSPAPAPAPALAPSPEPPAELEHQIVMSIVERVIAMIRSRRGLKAIESFEQVQFLACYVRWLRAGGRAGAV